MLTLHVYGQLASMSIKHSKEASACILAIQYMRVRIFHSYFNGQTRKINFQCSVMVDEGTILILQPCMDEAPNESLASFPSVECFVVMGEDSI